MIEIRDLSLSIHDTPILDQVSLSVAAGEVFGLVGESGSGKSMTALSLMRLLPNGADLSGAASFEGQDLLQATERQMCALRGQTMGMIFQEPMTALNPVKTIGDQVAETLRIHGAASRAEAYEVARERLDRVGLPQIALGRYPHELSGGQRQRVCIATAIALRPKLLIADEPTTALDVTTQAQILDLLKELVDDEGMALMLITHDLAVVAGMTDHVAVMKQGEIVEQGPTHDVLRQQRHPYTRALFEASGHQPMRRGVARRDAILSAETVKRHYPGPRRFMRRGEPVRAVNGVSLQLKEGESLGLVGESGCGKSTLTRAILGLDPIQGGEIRAFGNAVSPQMTKDMRAGIQVVFQDPYGSFNPRWTVEHLIAEPYHLLTNSPQAYERRNRVGEVLQAVGLSPADMDKYPHEFSGGQRQRIAIARALITYPKILVLDEAVSALDVRVRAQILDLLADLQDRLGLSYLFISHDLTVVRAITDRVLVMQAGQIVEEGPTARVFDSPNHPYTRALLAAAPRLPEFTLEGADP